MYICNICDCFLANKSDEITLQTQKKEQQLNFQTFKMMYNCKEDEFKKYDLFSHLYCKFCDQEIGMRIGKDLSIYKCQIKEVMKSINIGVYSLKQELLQKISQILENTCFQCIVKPLLKKELSNVQLIPNVNAAIIIHQVESRVLLLGKNGLYNDLTEQLWKQTCGNVLLILYDKDEKNNQEELIYNLATYGQQPQIAELYQSQNLVFFTEILNLNLILSKYFAKSYNQIYPVEILKKEGDVSNEKCLLLKYYNEKYKQINHPTQDDKLILLLINKSQKQFQFECKIQ
ncbi:unnamed protein product [Paramecium sonneborni]|uniref:Uncharacterized protein n=1 Tax=Paramecium sonneborni TaxID=65129 RepID=A0A8S1JZF7_9CILI|nr:unnamed protein product [Paramecium sonneborni]